MSRVRLNPTFVRAVSIALLLTALGAGLDAAHELAPALASHSVMAAGQKAPERRDEQGTLRLTSGWEWWRDEGVQKAIGLNPDQIRKIDRLFAAWLEETRPRMQELQRGLAELEAPGLDERAFAAKLETLGALHGRIWETRMLMLHRISRVATPEQRERLQQLFKARRKDHDGRGVK